MTRRLKKDIWPELVTLSVSDVSVRGQVEDWLVKNIRGFTWYIVYHYRTTDYYFKASSDATMFALRWS